MGLWRKESLEPWVSRTLVITRVTIALLIVERSSSRRSSKYAYTDGDNVKPCERARHVSVLILTELKPK